MYKLLDYFVTLADDISTAPLGSPGGCGAVLGREPLRVFWELILTNTICYVDGFNLYYRLLRHTPWKWLDIGAFILKMLPHDSKDISKPHTIVDVTNVMTKTTHPSPQIFQNQTYISVYIFPLQEV